MKHRQETLGFIHVKATGPDKFLNLLGRQLQNPAGIQFRFTAQIGQRQINVVPVGILNQDGANLLILESAGHQCEGPISASILWYSGIGLMSCMQSPHL
ncbi:hypothetical protein HMPREF9103_02226 [Lentilactobacillus parafarraginis F0439]|uniref:Uncharacterized protein n=1 Tax=Lentilactobacillus parafarraginis F0439 TaxID=797515 RepID=G9ZR66_9LACO|nr:hypothetical protein HMPREF9103_02226 [Lentilactobacillus parafarraginis F0439]